MEHVSLSECIHENYIFHDEESQAWQQTHITIIKAHMVVLSPLSASFSLTYGTHNQTSTKFVVLFFLVSFYGKFSCFATHALSFDRLN